MGISSLQSKPYIEEVINHILELFPGIYEDSETLKKRSQISQHI